ncbi:hypothetical protein ACROYT_G016961 [Oculina patagonica]
MVNICKKKLKAVVIFFCLSSVWLSVESVSKTQSLRSILNHFNSTRNVNVDPAAKQRARDFIVKSFNDHGLHTWTEEFPSNQQKYPGVNIVGRLPGRYTGKRDDKIVLIGSHYDSVQTTPGVDDNGSGMTALLQALKLYTSPDKMSCTRDYTLLFVAFDLEEVQPVSNCSGNCSCPRGLCGSGFFVQNLTQYLNSSGAGFQGAFVLETILNHNSTPHSQIFPQSLQQYFPQVFGAISKNQFRGDFLALIGRSHDDGKLLSAISNAFKKDNTFKTIAIGIPGMTGRPSNWPSNIRTSMRDFFRSDHYRFWDAEPSLPAVFVTDSANFRGFMQQCYHKDCDDINHVTPEMVTFMGRTTDSVVKVVTNMTNEKCQMKKTECTEQKTADVGEIMTPYYDKQYPNKLDCEWTITVGSDRQELWFSFTTFDLEESVNCTADYVVLRDGKDKTSPLIGKYCGRTLPDLLVAKASTRSLYIMFHSDELDAFKGFKAKWGSSQGSRPTGIKSAVQGYRPEKWQLIGFLVLTSLAIGL